MAILLPSTPGIRGATPSLIDAGAVLAGGPGSAAQKLNRLGTRHALTVRLPLMRSEPLGRIYAARLRQAQRDGAIITFPQDGLTIGSPGAPLVNGAGQTGMTINLDGFAAGYQVREGQFFSIIIGSRRYLYSARTATTANGSGQMALPIMPMIRVSPPDNAVCEFAAPKIEGFLTGGQIDWEVLREPFTQIPDFTISEAE
ncbi:hypothetical protein SAMN06295912_108114 [Sphingomonas laterariae]|uniref:Uncharacterized protein n=1 Tax=Edaphosphingomonas laterariae TaxID=861865 RepID=A0A239F9F4_9SPHN|nr:hypothetical protein [Sphingomonas laterariae]SNS53108.1 hypothetical protein SAMN06295912_108114 [Sphingomonas laterariae]